MLPNRQATSFNNNVNIIHIFHITPIEFHIYDNTKENISMGNTKKQTHEYFRNVYTKNR